MADDINWGEPPTETPAEPQKSGDIDWSQPPSDAPSKLDISVQQAQQTPPDTAARVLNLQSKTGLDPDLITRNLDEIEKQANAKGFDATEFQKNSPIVSSWMAEHPTKAAIAQPDAEPLSAVESFFKRDVTDPFLREMDAQKRWELGEKAHRGTITPEDRDQLAEIDARMAARAPGGQGFVDSVLQNWVGGIPTLGRSLWEGAKGAAIGAAAGAVAGEGVGAIPGAAVGFPAGMATYFARMEQGNAYLDLEKQGVSRPVAMGAATVSGTITGLMMALTGGASGKVAVPALASLQREGLQTLLENPTTAMAIKGYLADIGKQVGIMGAFSGASSMVDIASKEVAKMIDDKSIHAMTPTAILGRIFSSENLATASEATKSGMVGGAGFGIATSLAHEIGRYQETRAAMQRGKDIEMAGTNLALTKVWQEAPQHAEELISRMTKDTPNEHAYVPMASWNEYWMKKEVDPRAAWESAAGDTESYDEAQRTGADLQLPMSKYMTTIGASQHGKHFSEEVRTDPAGMNAKEAEKFAKTEVKAADEQATASEETPITPAQLIVQQARQQQGLEDFFPDPKKVGMNDEQAAAFTKAEANARFQAEQEIQDKLMRKAEKVRQAQLGEQREQIEKDVTAQVDARKDQFARAFLTKGTQPNGEALPEGMSAFKLSREAINEDFSDMDTSNLPRGSVVSKQKATNAEITARAEASRAREMAVYEAEKQSYDLKKEIIGKGVSIPEDVKQEGKRLPSWMRNPDGRPLDEIRDQLVEKGFIGPNDDVLKFLESTKPPERLPTKDTYFTRAKQELAQEMSTTGGVHPDEAAPFLGYSSGEELIDALNKSKSRNEMIEGLTKNFMTGEGEIVSQPEMADAALAAVHNDARAQVLQKGLKYMLSDNFAQAMGLVRRLTRRLPPLEEIRDQAESIIDAKKFRDTQPTLYQREISKATREAGIHFTNGDFDSMFEAKQRELLNHELFRAAADAKEEITDRVAGVTKYSTDKWQEKIGKAGGEYLDQLNNILERFDFKKSTSLQELGKRSDLRAWVEEQKAQGYDPILPDKVLNDAYRQSYKDMPNGEVKQVLDSIDTITHLAALKNKLIGLAKERDFEETVNKAIGIMADKFKITPEKLAKEPGLNPDFKTRIEDKLNGYGSWLTTKEPLFQHLGIHDIVYRSINDAEDFKTSHNRIAIDRLEAIANEHYSDWERAKFGRMTYIPELEGTKIGPNLDRMQRIMTLLHSGNEGNFKEMLRGYGINEGQMETIHKTLEPKDIKFAQKIWDFVGSYRDLIGKQAKELNGVEPRWIEGRPLDITAKDGSVHHLEGGYFPLVYDRNMNYRTAALDALAMTKDMFPSYTGQTATWHGYEKARIGGGGQSPSLNFSVFTNHVFDVIHDLAYRKPIIDTYKLLNDSRIQAHIQEAAGKGEYAQLHGWLKRIAGDRSWEPLGPLQTVKNVANNMTLTELGLKVGSALVHTTSVFPATNEIGLGYMGKGFKAFSSPVEATKFMFDSSEFMRARWQDAGDRDIRAVGGNLNLANTQRGFLNELKAMSPIEQKHAWILMRSADMAIAGPTWYGAYLKARDGFVDGIKYGDHDGAVRYADQLVRKTKGSGAAKDLAPYQTAGGSVGKLFTMFQTQLNVILNQQVDVARDFKIDKDVGALAAGVMSTWIVPAITAELLRGKTPKEDEGWLEWGAKAVGKFPFLLFPPTNPIVRYFENPHSALTLIPVEEALTTMAKTAKNIATKNPISDAITGEQTEWTDQDYRDAALSLGYARGIPGMRQAVQSATRLQQWYSGAENPKSPIYGLGRVLIGTKKPG